jgi:hypothetical protein
VSAHESGRERHLGGRLLITAGLLLPAPRPQQSTLFISQVRLYCAAYAVRLKLVQELTSDLELGSSWLQVNTLNEHPYGMVPSVPIRT